MFRCCSPIKVYESTCSRAIISKQLQVIGCSSGSRRLAVSNAVAVILREEIKTVVKTKSSTSVPALETVIFSLFRRASSYSRLVSFE